jgi:MFS family permease
VKADIDEAAVAPIEAGRPVRGRLPAALRYADFRVLWASSLLGGTAFTGERVVVGWMLLDHTDSPFLVGLGLALNMLPNLLLGVPSGALADRFDRRALMRLSSGSAAANAAVLGLLGLAGLLAVWQVLVLSLASGCLRTLGGPARWTYVVDVVGPGNVVSGMAMTNLGQRIGGVIGALGAGAVLAELGVGAGFVFVAAGYACAGAMLFLARSRGQAAPVKHETALWRSLGEYAGELRGNRTLAMLVFLTAAVEILGFSYQALLPSIARDRLDIGAGGLGVLNAAAAAGGIASIVMITVRGTTERTGALFLGVILVFGVALILLGAADTVAIAVIVATLVAGLAALSDLFTQSLVQSAVPNELRGRAMGSWSLAIGLGPLGSLQIGALAAALGVTVALTTNGVALIVLGAGSLLLSSRLRKL